MALDGVKCRGYATRQAREEDYCGYWDSEVNPLAAEPKQRRELLAVGPYCISETGKPAYCSPNATRTQRSGITDVDESMFARQRLTPEAGNDIEECRANLTARVEQCHLSCDTCKAECTNPTARGIVAAYRCSVGMPTMGMAAAFHTTDEIGRRWGAKRTEGRPAAPDASYQEQYRVLVQNRIDKPLAPRNSISCRKPHRESSTGEYTPALDKDGAPTQRQGFMVGCNTDLDCYSRCGSHPVSGQHYVCTKHVDFYTVAGHSNEAYKNLEKEIEALKAAGEEHSRVWLPDADDKDFYLIEEPGDDSYDVTLYDGVCTDTHLDYLNTGCGDLGGAKTMLAVAGCSGRAFGWATLFCGVIVETVDDYVTDVGISEISLLFPRVLQEEAKFQGQTLQRLTCSNPFDCQNKCESLERRARAGGLPAPAACALCNPPCPDNPGTSLVWTVHAFVDDVASALQLAAICLNPAACVCQIMMMIRPAWLDEPDNPVTKCQMGDIMVMLLDQIGLFYTHYIEFLLNINPWVLMVRGISAALPFVDTLPPICFPYTAAYDKAKLKECPQPEDVVLDHLACSSHEEKRLERQCYFERVDNLCSATDDSLDRYQALFEHQTVDELESKFQDIFQDSSEVIPPSMKEVFKGIQGAGVNTAAQQICSDREIEKTSMSLDKAIVACIFAAFEAFCPNSSGEDNKLQTFLNEVEWQLPRVVWDWAGSPPPPPPVTFGAYEALVKDDPSGMEVLREKLEEFWPALSLQATQSAGSQFGFDHSADGQGYGPLNLVTPYAMTTAFLSTAHYKDQDSLSARMMQSRFTGMFRFSCKAFVEWSSDKNLAGAGAYGAQSAWGSADDFRGSYDRNWMAMAAALYEESFFAETGERWAHPGVHNWWYENCEEPAGDRSAVPTSVWSRDPLVYGERDAFGHEVPMHEYAPLRAFGSLRQLRDPDGGVDGFEEDYTNTAFEFDRNLREGTSLQALYRDVLCNPTYKYSIENAVGNPLSGRNNVDPKDEIRDASSRKRNQYDMRVPAHLLGESAARRRQFTGCGLGIASGGCDVSKVPTYLEGSLWSWAYVTSSDDPEVPPGWHRLLYLRAFSERSCAENARQVCNSKPNTLTFGENFDVESAVIAAFKAEMGIRYQNAIVAAEDKSDYRYTVDTARHNLKRGVGGSGVPPLESWYGRRLQVTSDGVYDVDDMLERASAGTGTLDTVDGALDSTYYGLTRAEAIAKLEMIRDGFGPTHVQAMINGHETNTAGTHFRTGMQALFATRCSDRLKRAFPENADIHCCEVQPTDDFGVGSCTPARHYVGREDCVQRPLELADTRSETLSEEYLTRFAGLSPPPSPPPSPGPPPPPSPPSPPPPPSPPEPLTAERGRALAKIMERQFCDAVYMISAEARCSLLATRMQQVWQLDASFTPPAPAPLLPEGALPPPPTPSPPRPRLPVSDSALVVHFEPTRVTLSTYFLGEAETDPDTASTAVGNLMPLTNVANATRTAARDTITNGALPPRKWAACSQLLTASPLPCRTGDTPARCLDGARRCGTTEANTEAPWLELDLADDRPTGADHYFFGLEFSLPSNPEFAALFFESSTHQGARAIGDVTNKYYTLEVFDAAHNPLPVQCKPYHRQSIDVYSDGLTAFQYVCLEASATDNDYTTMRNVHYVRFTLLGEYRMLWLEGVRVVWRALMDLPPSAPPSPHPPPGPPQPSAPPDAPAPNALHVCATHALKLFPAGQYAVAFHEPCGLTADACCALAYEHTHTAVYALSAAGCCTLYDVPDAADRASLAAGTPVPTETAEGFFGAALTGVRTLAL